MTADMLHHHLDLTSANNLLTIHHHHNHHHHHQNSHHNHHHGGASSVTSDQYSSLNLSSVGSSASSAHHSPIMEHYEAEVAAAAAAANPLSGGPNERPNSLEGHFNSALKLVAGRNSSACSSHLGASSDYTGSQASLPPCSPVSQLESPSGGSCCSPLDADLASLSTASSPAKQQQQQVIINHLHTTKHQHNHLHPNDHQQRRQQFAQQQQQQHKVRSFSHSTSFSPFQELQLETQQQQLDDVVVVKKQQKQVVEEIVERPRRLSRIENRQSLHDLGYGQIESYFKLQRLGKGTYATVYMGRSRVNNDLVALKEILKEHDEGAPCTAIREVSLLRLLRHNNIVTLHDICHTPKKLTLVFEYVGLDLYAYMKENNHLLSIHNVRLLLFQLLRGIAFCHSRQVLHRDLKPQNLLINTRGELKICDFGLARAKSIPTKSYSNEVVTLWYRPPDVLLGNTDYNDSIDMWGVGCIFYEMASGRTFFPGSSVRQQLYLIFSSLGAPQANNWPEILTNPDYLSYSFPSFRPEKLAHRVPRLDQAGVQLLQSFLRFKPSERLAAHEAMRDPFFACLPHEVHRLNERESIFDVPGVYMSLNPGQKLANQQNQQYFHSQ